MDCTRIDIESVREAFDFLILKRLARTLSGDGPKLLPNESETAKWLLRQSNKDSDDYELLQQWLAAYGFDLHKKDSFTTDGIPKNSTWFFIIRSSESKLAPWMGLSELRQKLIPPRRKEEEHVTRRWAYFLWYMLLGLLYTRINRLPESTVDHTKAWFTKAEFVDFASEKIEELRNVKLEERSKDIEMLLQNSDWKHIEARVSKFLSFLVNINHIAKTAHKDEYVQTLIGAMEIAQHARVGFSHIINDQLIEEGFTPEQFEQIYEENPTATGGGQNGSV